MLFNGVPANIMALAGLVFAFIMTCLLLVKCNDRLPKDQGREFAVNGALSVGKPRGAGFIFILVFIVSVVLFCELNTEIIIYLVLLAAAMMTGFLDDCSRAPWGELKKGLLDFAIAVMVAITFLNFNSNVVEFAIFGGSITIPPVIFRAQGSIRKTFSRILCPRSEKLSSIRKAATEDFQESSSTCRKVSFGSYPDRKKILLTGLMIARK